MARLLEGVRVLDLTNVLAGPFCCYQLALLGAEVIKVEVPGVGDLARQLGADPALNAQGMGASFLAQNAGKRSITLNLKHADGEGSVPPPRGERRRRGRELPPGRDGAARARLRGPQGGPARPHLLRDLGLRPGRAALRQPGLRPDHPGALGRDERDRQPAHRAACASAIRSATRWAGSPRPSRSPPRSIGAARPARARRSTSRCSRRRWSRWAGRSRTG